MAQVRKYAALPDLVNDPNKLNTKMHNTNNNLRTNRQTHTRHLISQTMLPHYRQAQHGQTPPTPKPIPTSAAINYNPTTRDLNSNHHASMPGKQTSQTV